MALYLAEETRDDEREAVRAHLDTCDQCRELVAGLVRTLVSAEPDEQTTDKTLPRGTNLARYVVLDPIGRGGMGVVYSAYDPELDRKVALKLLRPDFRTSPSGTGGRHQLLAEAQAMARLSHPNIITVFDVGTFEEEVFFAMEFVRGQTLRSVQASSALRPQRMLDLYLAAGTGLAAAHEAGIIHRDFKPENVLVGDDGRVCVTDFGLARPAHDVDTKMAGTPAYMAPEQWRGAPADVRTDQYSYCVALYEGLYGSRPVRSQPGPTEDADGGGRAAVRVPPGVGRVLSRGLQTEPEARWPSMEALVGALREARRPFRTRTLLATGALLLLTIAVWAQHALEVVRAERELTAAARRLPELLRGQHDLIELQANIGLRAKGVEDAFVEASNMDAALGLAENASKEQQFAEAHEVDALGGPPRPQGARRAVAREFLGARRLQFRRRRRFWRRLSCASHAGPYHGRGLDRRTLVGSHAGQNRNSLGEAGTPGRPPARLGTTRGTRRFGGGRDAQWELGWPRAPGRARSRHRGPHFPARARWRMGRGALGDGSALRPTDPHAF